MHSKGILKYPKCTKYPKYQMRSKYTIESLYHVLTQVPKLEKGELRPEVLVEPELRDGEVVMLVSSENIVLW